MLNMDCPGLLTQAGSCYLQCVDWSAQTIQVTPGHPCWTTAAVQDKLNVRQRENCCEKDDLDVHLASGYSVV